MGVRALFSLCILLMPALLGAQPKGELETQWKTFHQRWPQTQLRIVLNQHEFVPGDTVWLALYFTDTDNRFMGGVRWINVDLWNVYGMQVVRQVIELRDGWGSNQLVLPASLAEGFYRITAHSSWMKNFGNSQFFNDEIRVFHRNEFVAQNPWSRVTVLGGPLVANLAAKVQIQSAVSRSSISLFNEQHERVLSTTTDSQGKATITFTPQAQTYYLLLSSDTTRYFLPAVKNEGMRVAVTLVDSLNETLHVQLQNGTAEAKQVTLAATRGSRVVAIQQATISGNDRKEVEVSLKGVPAGMLAISLLGGTTLIAYDHICWRGKRTVVDFRTNQSVYAPREKVELSLALKDGLGNTLGARFSVRVVNQSLFREEAVAVCERRYMASPAWQLLFEKFEESPRFGFTNLLERKGVAYDLETGKPLPDFTQVQFFLQNSKLRHRTFTYDNGKINFALPGVIGHDELFYFAQLKGREFKTRIEWEQDSVIAFHASALRMLSDENVYARFARNKKLTDQAFNNMELAIEDKRLSSLVDFETEVASADIMIDVADYIQFETIEDLVKEVIPSLFVRTRRDEKQVRVALPGPMKPATSAPIFVVDGYTTRNSDFFLNLKPTELERIGVVYSPKKLMPLGMLGANGIVLIETKSGNKRDQPADEYNKVVGANRPFNFHNNQHPPSGHAPLFRSTLFWLPQVQTENGRADLSFYLSDDVTDWGIYVEGVNDSGEWFSAYHRLPIGKGK